MSESRIEDGCRLAGQTHPTTIDEVFDELTAAERTADDVVVTYDDRWAVPGSVEVDVVRNAIDDEYSFGAIDLEARPLDR